jgi:hypothetical protein
MAVCSAGDCKYHNQVSRQWRNEPNQLIIIICSTEFNTESEQAATLLKPGVGPGSPIQRTPLLAYWVYVNDRTPDLHLRKTLSSEILHQFSIVPCQLEQGR